MSNMTITVEQINSLKPSEVVRNPLVRERFITIYDNCPWGEGSGEAAYEEEAIHFSALLRDSDQGALLKATPFSIFTAFIDLAVCGLSLKRGPQALCYLTTRNVNVGTRDRAVWEKRAILTISGYGELVLRARAGQIRHADNPVIVYDNDEFSFGERDGRKFVNYTCNLPHTGHKIVACYMRITRADGTVDYAVMSESDWLRLAGYSQKQNSKWNAEAHRWEGKANALYSSGEGGNIDPGFLVAKCIKHAFKTYPKVRMGKGTELQSQQVEEPQEITDDIYGVADMPSDTAPGTFAPRQDISTGVVIDDAAADDDVF